MIPAGSTHGKIKVKTNFGEVESDFLFRDNRNTIMDFDTYLHETWTAPVAYADSAPDPATSPFYPVKIYIDNVPIVPE
jgi:hypothetical protein